MTRKLNTSYFCLDNNIIMAKNYVIYNNKNYSDLNVLCSEILKRVLQFLLNYTRKQNIECIKISHSDSVRINEMA